MAYTESIYISPWGIEHVISHRGRYGAKGEKRTERKKPTPEQIKKQNQKNKENRIRRLIQFNFLPGDLWLTLKYPRGTRKSFGEVKGDFKRFIRKMKDRFRKKETELKYIYRVEIGKRGGIHIHLVMNRLDDPKCDLMISDAWTRARGATPLEDMLDDGLCPADGLAHLDHVRAVGNGQQLAEYIAKPQPAELEDGTTIAPEDYRRMSSYGCSRNLTKPVAEKKTYTHWTVRKLIEMGPEKINTTHNRYRREGYLVDKESWVSGINPVTGMSYLHYTEIQVRRRR
jgi:hypothetical protein